MQTPNDIKMMIIKMLQWTEQEYAEHQYEQGIEYLERYIPNDPHGIKQLQRSKIFWQWWKNHWHIRDQRYVLFFDACEPTKHLQCAYKNLHAAKYLVSDIYPPAVVLGADYAKMIGELNDDINK